MTSFDRTENLTQRRKADFAPSPPFATPSLLPVHLKSVFVELM
jgi:hypothetical protein